MEHKIWYDDNKEILMHEINGFYSFKDAQSNGQTYIELLTNKPRKQMIVDLTNAGKMENRETRSIINKNLDDAGIEAVVFVGATAPIRMIAKVLMKLGTLKAESTFIKTRDEAISWLKKRRK
jgi:hypothetical protein